MPLVSGEIAEDITSYYAYSEQVPTVCALGVLVDKDLSISCAGGYLLQLLPGATDAEITQLEQNIAAMPSVTEMLQDVYKRQRLQWLHRQQQQPGGLH